MRYLDTMSPLAYILAPFVLALVLFVLYLVVSLVIGDPGRPFAMFASRPLDGGTREDRTDDDQPPGKAPGERP